MKRRELEPQKERNVRLREVGIQRERDRDRDRDRDKERK